MNQGWFAKRGIGKGDKVQGLEQISGSRVDRHPLGRQGS